MLWTARFAPLAVVSALALVVPAAQASAAPDPVTAMTAPLYQLVNPTTKANLVTPWPDEAAGASSSYGFTVDLGSPFKAATDPVDGLAPVHRLFKSGPDDFTWALEGSPQLRAATSTGYSDEGTNFYAAATQLPGTVPVNSYVLGSTHRLWLGSDAGKLTSAGWTLDAPAFFVPGVAAPVPPPPPAGGTSGSTVGALPVGQAAYPAPADAVFVATNGNDASSGSAGAPVRTVSHAIDLASSGGTVVLRAGVYHESVVVEGKSVTIQNYPNEAAWLDGSEAVTGWVQDGQTWRKDGWTTRFDHSPTYSRGAPDNTEPDWRFVSSAYPMAAHPDQVFIDGVAMKQVASRNLVTAGTFFLDEKTSRLYIGDNPGGHSVNASTLVKAMSLRGNGTVVRGIGIRRYAPSVPDIAAVTMEAPGMRFENVVIQDSATTGLSVLGTDSTLDRVTVTSSGMLGIHTQYADRLTMVSVLATLNNSEHFNLAPVSGGAKLGGSRGVTVTDSSFSGNYGPGFWEDESNYDSVLKNSTFSDNTGYGISLEISAKAVVIDNLIARNQAEGLKVNNTSDVRVWNNTFLANVGRPIWLAQDERRNTDPNYEAVDKRQPFPDPTMPWTLGPVSLRNNVIAQGSGTSNCLLCVEDYSGESSAEQMGISSNGNVYQRQSTGNPRWLAVWSTGPGDPQVFDTLSEFTQATGQEQRGKEYVGGQAVDSSGRLTSAVSNATAQIAVPLPADLAAIVGQPTGTLHLGNW